MREPMIDTANLDSLDDWANNRSEVNPEQAEIRLALAVEHLAQAVAIRLDETNSALNKIAAALEAML